jgi:hypothetical protein
MPALRDTLLPPPRLFFPSRNGEPGPAERIRRICDAAVWRSETAIGKLRFAALALLWPLLAAFSAIPWLRRNGRSIRNLTGKGRLRQFCEMLGLALRHRIGPKYYSMFEFYLDDRRVAAGQYLARYELKQVVFRLLRPKVVTTGTPIKNKSLFSHYCAEHGLRAVPVHMTFRNGRRDDAAGDAGTLPETNLFVKRVFGKGGARAERWNWAGNGRYRSTTGAEKDAAALIAHIAALSRAEAYVVQPALANHPELRELALGALCTVRLVTCRNEQGRHELAGTAFRMPSNPEAPVDNIHAGGIAASVDLKTGRLGQASDLGLGPDFVWHDRHPVTGGVIAGRILPFWDEAVALALRAHDAFSEWTVIGWDVAILADGPCLIEGNKGPDPDLLQRSLRGPIGNGRYGELLAYNLERRLRGAD